MEKQQKFNSAGYDLYEITLNEWILHVKDGPIFVGTFKDIIRTAVSMGFGTNDLDFAVQEMVKRGHNGAHFGMYKRFIHTFQRDFAMPGRKAS